MDDSEIRNLERKARALIAGRDIPPSRMEVVRSLLNNESLNPEERYLSIIDLIKDCPGKKPRRIKRERAVQGDQRTASAPRESESTVVRHASRSDVADLYAPLESSEGIDRIGRKYEHLKLFKKRYLVHRDNRFGIGFRKRMIPTKRLLGVFTEVVGYQESITEKLGRVLNDILEDEGEKDPTVFNYIVFVRKWLLHQPLVKYRYNEIKWMERHQFEREFRNYIVTYYMVKKIDPKVKEMLLDRINGRLRSMADLKKSRVLEAMTDSERRRLERENLNREKEIYQFMVLLRSFLSTVQDDDLPLSVMTREKYGIKNYSELLMMIMEVLVFQRTLSSDTMISYYGIDQPVISSEVWDYNDVMLRKYRKDRESLASDRTSSLKNELAKYDTISFMLHVTDAGENLLIRAADDQWRIVDKKHYNTRLVYTENFFGFLDAVINYFYHAFIPLMDGTKMVFRDAAHHEHESSLFSPFYFESDIMQLNNILNEIHLFRSSNPSLAVTWSEVKKTMEGRESTPSHLWRFILGLGEFFYSIGTKTGAIFDMHKLWVYGGKHLLDQNTIRRPLEPIINDEEWRSGYPIPFYDCAIIQVPKVKILEKNLAGKRLLNDTLDDGVFVRLIAFAYQTAFECFNKKILSDMNRRKELAAELKSLG